MLRIDSAATTGTARETRLAALRRLPGLRAARQGLRRTGIPDPLVERFREISP